MGGVRPWYGQFKTEEGVTEMLIFNIICRVHLVMLCATLLMLSPPEGYISDRVIFKSLYYSSIDRSHVKKVTKSALFAIVINITSKEASCEGVIMNNSVIMTLSSSSRHND